LHTAIRRLGLLALGQTPRDDVAPTFRSMLGRSVQILEAGALDGLSADALGAFRVREGEAPLETRLRGGIAIELSREALLPRLLATAAQLADRCDSILLLCSGENPALAAACPKLIQPIHILRGAIDAIARQRVLGLIGPASDLDEAPAQWAPYAPRLLCAAASPYGPPAQAEAAGRDLAERGAQVIYLDCMGFNEAHRVAISRSAGLPVLAATTLTARVLCEMI
jgi:protein AroM